MWLTASAFRSRSCTSPWLCTLLRSFSLSLSISAVRHPRKGRAEPVNCDAEHRFSYRSTPRHARHTHIRRGRALRAPPARRAELRAWRTLPKIESNTTFITTVGRCAPRQSRNRWRHTVSVAPHGVGRATPTRRLAHAAVSEGDGRRFRTRGLISPRAIRRAWHRTRSSKSARGRGAPPAARARRARPQHPASHDPFASPQAQPCRYPCRHPC